jgi:hypothetical protein
VKAIIGIGLLAVLALGYALFVFIPERNRLLVEHDLKGFALLYHEFNAAQGRSPGSLADLESFARADSLGGNSGLYFNLARVFEMVRNGRFVIIWDAVFFPDSEENEKYVLGHEPHAAEDGGLVMRASGSVQRLTAAEFNALPRIETRIDR